MRKQFSPEESQWRKDAARAIKEQRTLDKSREASHTTDFSRTRGLLEYTEALEGLTHFLAYIKALSFKKSRLLDIGAGDTRAMSDLEKAKDLSYNLEILTTSLTKDKEADRFLGGTNIIQTSVESLNGINDDEISGIISVYGVGHSEAPELAVDSIDRVLMPSGAIKINWVDYEDGNYEHATHYRNLHSRLVKALKGKKFDVTTMEVKGRDLSGKDSKKIILLAIKPPIVGITAAKLLSLDSENWESQMDALQQQGFEPVQNELMEKRVGIELKRFFDSFKQE